VKAVADRVTVLRGGRCDRDVVAIDDATPRSLAALMVGRELAEATRGSKPRQAAEDDLSRRDGLCADGDRGRRA
jgi:ABC-type uncharacterized transport system ATPase subunit